MNPMRSSVLLASSPFQHALRLHQLDQKILLSLYNSAPRHSRIACRPLHNCANPVRLNNANTFRPATILARCAPVQYPNLLSSRLGVTAQIRHLSKSPVVRETPIPVTREQSRSKSNDDADEEEAFQKSEKATQASQINLSARLSKEGNASKGAGLGEIWRLIKIARPEARILILDMATKGGAKTEGPEAEEKSEMLFGLSLTTFYTALFAILATGAAANYGRIIILRIVGERIVARLRSRLFRQTYVQNAEFFDANRVGDLISRLSSDTIIVGKSITQNLSDGLRAFVSGAAGFGLMAWVSLKLTGILGLLFPPVAIAAFFYGRAIRNLSRKIQKNLGTLTKIAEERLGNVRTSQAFAGEILEVHRYNTQVRKIFDLGKRESLISATFFSTTGFMGNMTILTLLYAGGGMVSNGTISIGELTSFLMYTAYAGSSLFGLSSFYSELMKGVGAASRLFELQDREPTISPTKGDKVVSARGPIRFENLTFSYPTRPAVKIFQNLDFEIPQGTNVAIVGPSGGGKSTIASLILRFYTPTEGRILIDGKDISKMNVKSLRRKIGIVSQEPVLFSGTIAENIAYGRPHATRADILRAARRANCQFISDFPDGLDTSVGARGTQLSGGQKQRIAIARALVKEPDILILDEATSALDAESETLVNEALASLLKGSNTTISIAHRLSTIMRSDTIICLGNDGRVAEMGSYKDLSSRRDGAFTKLMEWQMSGGAAQKNNVDELAIGAEHKGPPNEHEEIEVELEDPNEGESQDEIEGSKAQETVKEVVQEKK
ncbi:ATP-binding cassette permease mdl1 [Exophiala xenobiotica]|nr:ATP-binding cassette permease mdl1 [Exophiala xenobiotica]KAK5244950.1 ATP-binding cassette permease mdl1 [Exophiala xenobiotica]KAK5283680.1 ATP-binding cassette permease mdl1 [Exophiala xenobiotica]KAK5345671.1 ATP-binding cassette permease mdl1 [Exophiala xenobiotica]KAK5360971.1 ATP-binding cassette permease mdl1 [Exophiala xenobiotica]